MKSLAKALDHKFDAYVEHPRYGRHPHYTGFDPNPNDLSVQLHWNATSIQEIQKRVTRVLGKKPGFLSLLKDSMPEAPGRISGTAIKADTARQNSPTVPVTHYYDVERVCRKCQQPFIFFAEEQKHWYEMLRFRLAADCVRCPKCRKAEQALARHRATYERLSGTKVRDWRDSLKMAGSALVLVENGIFGSRVIQTIRALVKTVPETQRNGNVYLDLVARLKQLGTKN